MAYILAVLLGSGEIAPRIRARFDALARDELIRLLAAFERGQPAAKVIR